MTEFTSKIRTIEWIDTYSKMVDQTKFPEQFEYVNITNGQDMFNAIKTMIVTAIKNAKTLSHCNELSFLFIVFHGCFKFLLD